jgi:hypothetical protein
MSKPKEKKALGVAFPRLDGCLLQQFPIPHYQLLQVLGIRIIFTPCTRTVLLLSEPGACVAREPRECPLSFLKGGHKPE